MQQLVAEQRGAGRWALARALCQRWQWRAPNGRWKTRSALAVLTELEQRGGIVLPLASAASGHLKVLATEPVKVNDRAVRTLAGAVNQYRPLRWELVGTVAQRRQWRALLAHYHYLGAPELVGANQKYLVFSRAHEWLAALGWQSAGSTWAVAIGSSAGMRPSARAGWTTRSTTCAFFCCPG